MMILTAVNFLVVSNLHEEEAESESSELVAGGGYVAVAETGAEVAVVLLVPDPANMEMASSPLIRSADSNKPFNSLNDASDCSWLIGGWLLGLLSPVGRGRRPKTILLFIVSVAVCSCREADI